jgi:hypothetical protein
MKSGLRNYLSCYVLIVSVFISSGTFAHIKNEASQFPDIEFSDARFEIVLLVGAGIIPETPVFEPDINLSRTDLASWGALAWGLGEGGETPDIRALARIALESGIIDTLEGDASFLDINNVIFKGQLTPEQATAVPTKAEAASYIAANLTTGLDGETLLQKRDMRGGPEGEVTAVESRMNPNGGSSYYISLAGQTYPLYTHGRVANGPTDLIQWQGRNVTRSFLRDFGEMTLWIYLEAEPVQINTTALDTSISMDESAGEEIEIQTNDTLLYGLIIAVLALGVVLFFRSKRS